MPEKYHHGNLRAVLIEEGVKLVEERGVNGLTLREISDRVGVSRTAPYRHFPDKAALLAAISEAGFTEFADALEAARDRVHGRFAAKLDAMGLAYLSFAEKRRAYYEVMFGAECGPDAVPGGPAAERAFGVLEELIRAGQAAGDVRPGDTIAMAKIVWATVHGIAMLRLETDYSEAGAGTKLAGFAGEILRLGLTLNT